MTFDPLSLLILKFRGQSIAILRDQCSDYEVSRHSCHRSSQSRSLFSKVISDHRCQQCHCGRWSPDVTSHSYNCNPFHPMIPSSFYQPRLSRHNRTPQGRLAVRQRRRTRYTPWPSLFDLVRPHWPGPNSLFSPKDPIALFIDQPVFF